VVELCLPGFDHNGRIYSYPQKKLMEFRPPVPLG
jgi:hypothetical protein